MPGHTLDHFRQVCTVCGMTGIEMFQAKTMECRGSAVKESLPARRKAIAGSVLCLQGLIAEDEEGFGQTFKEYAQLTGWEPYHTRNSKGSDPGFPDWVLARERMVYAELKMPGNKQTMHQLKWARILKEAGQEYYLWYPLDWPEIERVLAPKN